MTEVVYRPPRPDELAQCALVWHAATDDYLRKLNRPLPPPVLDRLVTLLEHLLSTDPDRFVVAVQRGQGKQQDAVVAFGTAAQRDGVWFLSQLYVLPDFQGTGVGTSILRRILPDGVRTEGSLPAAATAAADRGPGGGNGPVLATVTDSAQPTSNALYSQFGILPRTPMFNFVGRPAGGRTVPLPTGIRALRFAEAAGARAEPRRRSEATARAGNANPRGIGDGNGIAAAIDAIDLDVLGYRHRADHRELVDGGRVGFVYRTAAGEVVAYGYASASGRFGPVAALDEELLPAVLFHLLEAVEPRGATSAWVPGVNRAGMTTLLRAGLVIEGFPALLCWNRPFGSFERYLPAGPALL